MSVTTLAKRDWHFFAEMAGSVPPCVSAKTGGVEPGKERCGPGAANLSLGSS